jgi:alkylation response protein AidB-like acyl-CoA dehydrogenase
MDYDPGPEVAELRHELRGLIDEHVPKGFLSPFTDDPADLAVAQDFCKVLADRGRGASVWEQTAVREEMWAAWEPRGAQYMGVNWVGPIFMRHGTPEQQEKFIPMIAKGEVIWCQGFSEPNAGSDLAAIQTSAKRDGDGWRINGQKIWTSYATMAEYCFLLVRTSKGEKKQHGLSIFIVPMDAPGVEVRPIMAMFGPHHVNEVFFDDVWVTEADLLGPLDHGWDVVNEVLSFERVGIARYARDERLLQWAPAALAEQWETLSDEVKSRWARMLIHCRRARLMAYRVLELQQKGAVTPGDTAAYRIAVTRLDQESADVLIDIVNASVLESDEQLRFKREVEEHWRYSLSATVASGSTEVQRILLARNLLGA